MTYEVIRVNQAREYIGTNVSLRGHIQAIRRMGAITFVVLRDPTGTLQLVSDQSNLSLDNLSLEQAIVASGKIVESPGTTTKVEMQLLDLQPMSEANSGLPIEISKEKRMTALGLPALLDYRPLTLRNEKVRAIFKLEAAVCAAFREFLNREGFTEIHSSKIVATGTEGGANLFTVDYFGTKAYLAQSPQFYKQIMVGVFERVFEIGPVYRAEEHNTVRHLNEYISMDFEMGFIESERELIKMETALLQYVFQYLQDHCSSELAMHSVTVPQIKEIPCVTLSEAHEIIARSVAAKGSSPSVSMALEKEDLDPEAERILCEYFSRNEGVDMVFVTHYPWKVRPFYAMPETGTERSHSFDLLFRGLEVTTGGQRIHQYSELVERMKIRGLDPAAFEDYLQCFKYGMPPHGGLAIGLERLVKQLLGLSNIREAALFPRDCNRLSP